MVCLKFGAYFWEKATALCQACPHVPGGCLPQLCKLRSGIFPPHKRKEDTHNGVEFASGEQWGCQRIVGKRGPDVAREKEKDRQVHEMVVSRAVDTIFKETATCTSLHAKAMARKANRGKAWSKCAGQLKEQRRQERS